MTNDTKNPGCMQKSTINLAGFLARSRVNGPGVRAVVWVKGCPLRCDGCFNPEFWSFFPKNQTNICQLAEQITALKKIDGVTFSGGEPFTQADALATLGEMVREAGLSVITYTGFSYDEIIRKKRLSWQHLLSVTDLLIAGPYIPSLSCRKPWVGSSNQQLVFLTGTITIPSADCKHTAENVELTVSREGTITATGFPSIQFVRQLAFRCKGG
jgi:anaerobic ribonucleoside-triphosphate reductase activating protein